VKKIYIIIGTLCIGLLASSSYSQKVQEVVTIELPCYNTQELFKSLRENFKELPVLTGKADDEAGSTMSVWLNPIDNDWTIVATKKDISCVVGLGTDMKIIPTRKGTSI
jgi:hypothetical protein